MNTSKLKQPTVTGASKIPVKRAAPVSAAPTTIAAKPKPVPTIPPAKPVPTISQPPQQTTPKQNKTVLESTAPKLHDVKQPQPTQTNNKENKENISLNSTKKLPDAKVKGYTELKKSAEQLSELVNRFEIEKQNHAQQILAIEQKHKEELRAKDEIIRNLQYQLEAAQKRTHNAENELSTLQEDLSTLSTRNKSLEALLEEVNVDVVALQRIPSQVNTENIELRFKEFTEVFEREYEISMKCIKTKEELIRHSFDLSFPLSLSSELNGEEDQGEEVEKEHEKEKEVAKDGFYAEEQQSSYNNNNDTFSEEIDEMEDSAMQTMEVE